jgi:hypothetical protein
MGTLNLALHPRFDERSLFGGLGVEDARAVARDKACMSAAKGKSQARAVFARRLRS